jgi:hypothetical protein
MSIGDDDEGAPNRVTTLISQLAVVCGSHPTNAPQLAQDKRAACMLREEPMIAMLQPQPHVRSSRTCWPANGDVDAEVSPNRSSWSPMCSSLWR